MMESGQSTMRQLSKVEFKATVGDEMVQLGEDAVPPFDFWSYFDALPKDHFGGHDFSEGRVDYVCEDAQRRYQLIHVRCEAKNVFLVLVLDLSSKTVHGHYLLNLNEEYGIEHGS